MFKKIVRISGLLIFVLLFSGCLEYTEEVTIHEDNTVSGVRTITLDADVLGGMSAEDVFSEVPDEYFLEGFTSEGSIDPEKVTHTIQYTNVPIELVSKRAVELELGFSAMERVDDTFVVHFSSNATNGGMDDGGSGMNMDIEMDFKVDFSLTFPGEIMEAPENVSGINVNGNELKINEELANSDFSEDFVVIASAVPGGSGDEGMDRSMMIAIAGGAVLLLGVVGLTLSMK